jgi:tripartite motif-containing protein 71
MRRVLHSRSAGGRASSALAVVLAVILATSGIAAASVVFQLKWGDNSTLPGQLNQPNAVAVDGTSGSVYVADTGNNRIQKFSSSGAFLLQWGTLGTGDGQFSGPKGIAVDSAGSVYVSDTGNNRIQKFNSTGSFLAKWGSGPGSAPTQLSGPLGLAVDSNNFLVYVADTGNDRISVWSTTGSHSQNFGNTYGANNLNDPSGVAIDISGGNAGNIYVADTGNNRIEWFSPATPPVFVDTVGTTGTGNNQFSNPTGVAIDTADNVIVADSGNNRISVFDNAKAFVVAWTMFTIPFFGTSSLNGPKGVAVNPSATNNVFVADTGNQRIVQFNTGSPGFPAAPNFVRQFGTPNGTGNGQFLNPRGVALDPSGNVYVVDSGNQRVEKFDASGNFILKWGLSGSNPTGIAIDSLGNVYVTDSGLGTVTKFDSTGTQLAFWSGIGSGSGQFTNGLAGGIAVSGAHVYVVDVGGNRVNIFNTSLAPEFAFGSGPGNGNTQFNGPLGIAVDSSSNVFITDTLNNRVVEYTVEFVGPSATFVRKWGTQPSPGSADGQFNGPAGIATDAAGDVYVSDINNQRVQKFSGTGVFITKFGSAGTLDGQFAFGASQVSGPPLSLAGIAATSNVASGFVYVADINNNRIQRFGNNGDFTSLPPSRILDTRDGTGLSGAFTANQIRSLTVVGIGGVPASGVDAVLINMTATTPSAGGWLTVFPADATIPTASNLNFVANQTVANLVVVKVGHGGGNEGKISVGNTALPTNPQPPAGTVQVIGDVVGWYSDGSTLPADKFVGMTPNRILDTRSNVGLSGQFTANQTRDLVVTGGGTGVPTSADAVVLNVTATNEEKTGWLTLFPTGTVLPTASNLNFVATTDIANLVVAKVGTGGKVSIANTALPSSTPPAGKTDVVADVVGYYEATPPGTPIGARLNPITPQRLIDTRSGSPIPANGTITIDVPGLATGLPPVGGYTAVAVNVTAVLPTKSGWLTVFPSDASLPLASTLNFAANQTVANLVKVKVGADGKIKIANTALPSGPTPPSGTTHVVVDLMGFYTS